MSRQEQQYQLFLNWIDKQRYQNGFFYGEESIIDPKFKESGLAKKRLTKRTSC